MLFYHIYICLVSSYIGHYLWEGVQPHRRRFRRKKPKKWERDPSRVGPQRHRPSGPYVQRPREQDYYEWDFPPFPEAPPVTEIHPRELNSPVKPVKKFDFVGVAAGPPPATGP